MVGYNGELVWNFTRRIGMHAACAAYGTKIQMWVPFMCLSVYRCSQH